MVRADESQFDVAIVGGGFVGLALAAALERASGGDLKIALIDAAPIQDLEAIGADPRASAITAASRRLLDVLGVWPQLADRAQAIRQIDITDSPLEAAVRPLLLHFDMALDGDEPAAHMVENRDLLRALRAHVLDLESVSVFSPDRISAMSAGRQRADLELETAGPISARLVAAADGRRSSLRRMAGIKVVGWSYPQIGIAACVEHDAPHEGHAVQHFLPAGPFAILPLKGNRSSLVWSERRDRGAEILADGKERVLQEIERRFGPRLGRVRLAGPYGGFPLEMHIARAFVAERLALLGDAAHGLHPLAGQGLNIGLRDVAALAEVVVETARLGLDIGGEATLERYQRWRRFDSALSATAMDGLNRLFSNNSDGLRVVRALGLGVVERLPALKRFFVAEAAGFTGETPRLLRGEQI